MVVVGDSKERGRRDLTAMSDSSCGTDRAINSGYRRAPEGRIFANYGPPVNLNSTPALPACSDYTTLSLSRRIYRIKIATHCYDTKIWVLPGDRTCLLGFSETKISIIRRPKGTSPASGEIRDFAEQKLLA
ncbi:hypothetical protein OPQ81_010606 [Rhizoctonia solani]|nr:hypothetical protein OPQ81_010606 [Rhizoctonia solani]